MIDFSKCPNCKGDWIWESFTRKRVCSNDCRLFIYSITGEWVAKKFKNYFIRWDNRGVCYYAGVEDETYPETIIEWLPYDITDEQLNIYLVFS